MKRYTVIPPNGITSLGSKYGVIQDVIDKPDELFKLFDKLGEYEDIGLTPKEVREIKQKMNELKKNRSLSNGMRGKETQNKGYDG